MAIRKITRKVITPVKVLPKDNQQVVEKSIQLQEKQPELTSGGVEETALPDPPATIESGPDAGSRPVRSKKVCSFCQNKTIPTYTDLGNLRRFLTDRAKIVARERSGVCSRHQRGISKNIKYARHLALLPFVPKV